MYATPGGVFKYFQTLGAYLFLPFTPALIFGILSKKVTTKGAAVSVFIGTIITSLFLADEFMGPELGQRVFPWLHRTLTLNYSYRGEWGFLIITAVLFAVSAFTTKSSSEKLVKTTVDWNRQREVFSGLSDWRLHLLALAVLTILIYVFLW